MTLTRRIAAAISLAVLMGSSPAAGAATASPGGATPSRTARAAGAGAPTRVVANCVKLRKEPTRVVTACGDYGEYVVVRHYDAWGRTKAVGDGRLAVNTCTPDCAAGNWKYRPAHMVFHRVVDTKAGPVFSRLDVTFHHGTHERHLAFWLLTRPI